ncbi:hypothetical protein GGS24DRAFT_45741 [Hypoxylon argillaceum]|nr:hypothetical protein GGS24DRAFT_45741 [Hypoxylon argillaceum]
MQLSAKRHTLEALGNVSALFEEVAQVLDGLTDARSVGSIEIQTLALILQLTHSPTLNTEWLAYGQKVADTLPTVLKRLYDIMLHERRIWDFHDLLVLMADIKDIESILDEIFGTDLVTSLKTVISDWSKTGDEYDSPTTLALLSILTHIVLEPIHSQGAKNMEIMKLCTPQALLVFKHDPTKIKCRPYLRFLLAHSRFTEVASHNAISSLVGRLESSGGICFYADPSQLPIYVPNGTDTLYWASSEISSEEKASANLVSRAAKSFKDIRTEILALQELIRLSANPVNEFDRLCELQLGEGDLVGYGYSLASRYLITKTAQERETLKSEIRGLLAKVDTPEFCDPPWKWVITMIMYKLEDRSLHGICFNLHNGMPYYRNMDAAFLKQISQKSPELSSWVDQQLAYNNTKQQAQTNYSYTDKGQKGRKVRSQVNQDSHQPQLPPAQPTESGEGASEPMPDLNFQRPQRHERAVNIVAPSKGSQGMEYDMKRLRDRFNRPLNGGIEPQPRRYFKKRQSEGDEVPKRQESQRKKADESHTRQMDEGEDKSPTEDEVKIEFEHGKYSVRIERERHAAKLKREKRIAEIESEKRAAEASQLLERERERGRYAEHERERERERDARQAADREQERERERERHAIELKNERDSARQTAERERDK